MPAKVTFPDFSANRELGVAQAFVCTLHPSDVGPTWVHVAGDLDIASAPRLDMALGLTGSRHLVILDLRALSFIDSSGVSVIVGASARARQANGWFVVIRGCPQVDRMLVLSGAADVLNIVDLDLPEPRELALSRHAAPDDAA